MVSSRRAGSRHNHDHRHADGGPGQAGRGRWLGWLRVRHDHGGVGRTDPATEATRDGMRALWVSLAGLVAVAAVQAVVVVMSGSVALLGDTLHNLVDALTAVPLGVAFLLSRRAASRRYTYGYGRAEDIAGILIIMAIAASAVAAGYQAIDRLLHPAEVTHLPAVAAAGLIGFVGNERVAGYRIRVGRRIGSAALVADGLHARTDGLTSLAVLASAAGVAAGWQWADPAVGLAIVVMIAGVLAQALRQVRDRLMDAVDPYLVDQVEDTLRDAPGVLDIGAVHLRWIGHRLRAECEIVVDARLTVVQAHTIAADAEYRLRHAIPGLAAAIVHADPHTHSGPDHHPGLSHHETAPATA